MFLHVLDARYLRDYCLWLSFSDGTEGEVDLQDELDGPVFEPLRDVSQFRRFSIQHHTVTWENGADFASEFLRERVTVSA